MGRGSRGEPSDAPGLFKGYVAPVSAIPVVAGSVGLAAFARTVVPGPPGLTVGSLLLQSAASYLLGLAGMRVFGKIVQALAPRFGGTGDEARRLLAHGHVAGGDLCPGPSVGHPVMLGLCSLCMLCKGAPAVARVPEDRALAFTPALVVCAVAVNLAVVFVASALVF